MFWTFFDLMTPKCTTAQRLDCSPILPLQANGSPEMIRQNRPVTGIGGGLEGAGMEERECSAVALTDIKRTEDGTNFPYRKATTREDFCQSTRAEKWNRRCRIVVCVLP